MESNELNVTLELLKDDLAFYNDMLNEVAMDILTDGYSQYPVFIAHQDDLKVGELIINANEYAKSFNMSATVLEELVERKIVTPERKPAFIEAYKDPKQFMCILLVTDKLAHFIFVPYKTKKQ